MLNTTISSNHYFIPGIAINILTYLSGDIEINPRPVICYSQSFVIGTLTSDNIVQIQLVEAYALNYNFDIICLSDTFLNYVT